MEKYRKQTKKFPFSDAFFIIIGCVRRIDFFVGLLYNF